MTTYSVQKYSASELAGLLDKHSHNGEGRSDNKSHLVYFTEYFQHVDAKTIVVEHPYTDKDYVEDYSAYYARCHESYKKTCTRLLFFDFEFDDGFLNRCMEADGENVGRLRSGFLGFIVVKPLPSTIIGRTCLKTYGTKERERCFPASFDCKAHLMGIELSVSSIPFQEQDTDVAACATSALWSALNCTGKLFQHHIPTPAEITKVAATFQTPAGRALPAANGLTIEQMADALRSERLEPLLLNASDLAELRLAAYAYLRARIPLVLLAKVGRVDDIFQPFGSHAIAITGYSTPKQSPTSSVISDCLIKASSIERLYAHDDQVGPFARLRFENQSLISTSWVDSETGNRGEIYLQPETLLVPLYHKIRVPIDAILVTVRALDEWFELARQDNLLSLSERLQWDIFLTDNVALKNDIFNDRNLDLAVREETLRRNLPRYIWRAAAFIGSQKQFELLYDATDLLQGSHFLTGLPYNQSNCLEIAAFVNYPLIRTYIQSAGPSPAIKSAEWFSNLIT